MDIPITDVDCSNVCFKVGKNLQGLFRFLMKWANLDFVLFQLTIPSSAQSGSRLPTNAKPNKTGRK
eukprot:7625091-Ditylum_brightwellii.AAC.1